MHVHVATPPDLQTHHKPYYDIVQTHAQTWLEARHTHWGSALIIHLHVLKGDVLFLSQLYGEGLKPNVKRL